MSPYWYAQGCVSHTPCGLHGEVWVIDWYARQGYAYSTDFCHPVHGNIGSWPIYVMTWG